MKETVLIQLRVNEKLKQDAVEVLDKLGLDLPTAMRMFLQRVVWEQGLPFSTSLRKVDADVPTPEKSVTLLVPAKKTVTVPSAVVEYIIRQIPAGKITRREDIQQFLQTAYGCERVELEHESVMLSLYDESFPYWRVVGNRGFLPSRSRFYSDQIMAEKLKNDGLSISMGGPKKALYKVDNYQDHLFDFSGIQLMPE